MVDEVRAESALRPIGTKGKPIVAPFHLLAEIKANRFFIRNLKIPWRTETHSLIRMGVYQPALPYWFLFIMLSGNPDKMYAVWVSTALWFGDVGKALTEHSARGNVRTMHLVYFPGPFPNRCRSKLGGNVDELFAVVSIIVIYDLP